MRTRKPRESKRNDFSRKASDFIDNERDDDFEEPNDSYQATRDFDDIDEAEPAPVKDRANEDHQEDEAQFRLRAGAGGGGGDAGLHEHE